ncbi:hypothetical protein [Sphingomonas sp. Leaf38]|uniref:hypothetical protein n=2 Tax=unclassified Sphingomonas TaxID=196159 RepID=UPI000B1622A1|nr:hypothetical protein [Sphingomonas sp. Leaf38]
MDRATGGVAWDNPQGCIERGTHAGGAATYQTRFSVRGYGMRTDRDRGGKVRSMGLDGKARCQTGGADRTDIGFEPVSLQKAIVTTYLSINGVFFPDRFPATFRFVRTPADGGRQFDIVEITPEGGRPALNPVSGMPWSDGRQMSVRNLERR